jgi:hypothetical protein
VVEVVVDRRNNIPGNMKNSNFSLRFGTPENRRSTQRCHPSPLNTNGAVQQVDVLSLEA